MAQFTLRTNVRDEGFFHHELRGRRTAYVNGAEVIVIARVRFQHGRDEGESPYDFQFGYEETGLFFTLITMEEFARRKQLAIDNGDVYERPEDTVVMMYDTKHVWQACEKLRDTFLALMLLDVFSVPVTL